MPNKSEPAPDRSVSAAERTMAILNAFLVAKGPLSLGELEEITGLFKSVILRYMITLTRESMVRKNEDGSYQLGTKVLSLAYSYEQSIDYLEIIRPSLQTLVAESRETASFYVREGTMRICLFRQNSPQSLRVSLRQGDTVPLDETSTGQVLQRAAEQPMLDGSYIRQSAGLIDPLTTSISTPVFGVREKLVGALTLSGPIGRFQPADPAVRSLLLREAARLSATFGSTGHYRDIDHTATRPRDAG
ncbi:IclR family transcriptional regulator [Azospirillum sp. RWY-5-1]|uniref:IclR family transcriptional regulator n=1 Tax=Azospirillum oleiclasticum TaxID=2735135 RepID=A0ABX2TCE7_9PROT|nr:IclR family transcriptional regulator [Azospirillum oleiclasticum]NYZ20823.1 IclR family transcriptional regulator [Azospirillum oleiclasticum]